VLATVKRYGMGFVTDEGATGLMLALHHGQHELASELLKQHVAIHSTDQQGWLAIDYMLLGFYKNQLLKYNQMATVQTIRQFWHLVKPPSIILEVGRQQLHIGGHSMLFFLIITMRTMQNMQPEKIEVTWPNSDRKPIVAGAFDMDDAERFALVLPDDILPAYRKNRSYINSVLATNEVGRQGYPGCKMIFKRVKRGLYMLNPYINWQNSR
jgi:hypothetical protein